LITEQKNTLFKEENISRIILPKFFVLVKKKEDRDYNGVALSGKIIYYVTPGVMSLLDIFFFSFLYP